MYVQNQEIKDSTWKETMVAIPNVYTTSFPVLFYHTHLNYTLDSVKDNPNNVTNLDRWMSVGQWVCGESWRLFDDFA